MRKTQSRTSRSRDNQSAGNSSTHNPSGGKRKTAVQVVSESIDEIRDKLQRTVAMQESMETTGRAENDRFCARLDSLEKSQSEIFSQLEGLVREALAADKQPSNEGRSTASTAEYGSKNEALQAALDLAHQQRVTESQQFEQQIVQLQQQLRTQEQATVALQAENEQLKLQLNQLSNLESKLGQTIKQGLAKLTLDRTQPQPANWASSLDSVDHSALGSPALDSPALDSTATEPQQENALSDDTAAETESVSSLLAALSSDSNDLNRDCEPKPGPTTSNPDETNCQADVEDHLHLLDTLSALAGDGSSGQNIGTTDADADAPVNQKTEQQDSQPEDPAAVDLADVNSFACDQPLQTLEPAEQADPTLGNPAQSDLPDTNGEAASISSWEYQKQQLMAQYGETYEPQPGPVPSQQAAADNTEVVENLPPEVDPDEKLTDWLSQGVQPASSPDDTLNDAIADAASPASETGLESSSDEPGADEQVSSDSQLDLELRRTEVELSIERARIARQRKQLEDKILQMKMKKQDKKDGLFTRLSRFLNGPEQDQQAMTLGQLANPLESAEQDEPEYIDPRDAVYYASPDDLRKAGDQLLSLTRTDQACPDLDAELTEDVQLEELAAEALLTEHCETEDQATDSSGSTLQSCDSIETPAAPEAASIQREPSGMDKKTDTENLGQSDSGNKRGRRRKKNRKGRR